MKEFEFEAFEQFLATQSSASKIYIGGDSRRAKSGGVWHADYAIVAIVHVDGCKGCRVFGRMVREPDFDNNGKKPGMRLMNEVYKVAELYEQIKHLLTRFDVEIHLDLNSKKLTENKLNMSHLVVQQAIGYIRGTCQVEPKIKPDALAASYGADHLAQIWHYQKHATSVKPKFRTRDRKKKVA
ncbi:hypothetical protein EVB91_301 [Rhizobium phage RHph_I1_18]|nr:hypothetical protein EVB91_301 [Rhizobium phage RHph_I1_18]